MSGLLPCPDPQPAAHTIGTTIHPSAVSFLVMLVDNVPLTTREPKVFQKLFIVKNL